MKFRGTIILFILAFPFCLFGQAGFEYSTRYFNSIGTQTKYEHTRPEVLVTSDSSLIAYGEIKPVLGTICPNPQNLLPCNQSIFLQKVDQQGDLVWRMVINGSRQGCVLSTDGIAKVIEARNGDLILLGYTDFGSNCSLTEPQYLLARISPGGTVIWKKLLIANNSLDQIPRDVIETRDGGFLVLAHTDGGVTFGSDMALIKTDAQGTVEWSRSVGFPIGSHDRPEAILEFPDGYLLTATKILGVPPAQSSEAYFLKLDTLGNKVWAKKMGNPTRNYEIRSTQKLDNNRFLVAGTYNFDRNFILKMDRLGNKLQLLYTPLGQGGDLMKILPGGQFVFRQPNDKVVVIDTLNNLLWSNTLPDFSGIARLPGNAGYALAYTDLQSYWDYILSLFFDQRNLYISQTDTLGKNLCRNQPGGSGYNWQNSNHNTSNVNNDHVSPITVAEIVPNFSPLLTFSDPNEGLCKNVCDTLPTQFTITSLPLCIGDTISISNSSSYNYNSFSWYQGAQFLGTGREPALIAGSAGIHTLKMVADGSLCRDSISMTYNVNSAVNANFGTSVNFQNIQFFNVSSGANQYFWDFGDGNTSTLASPLHFYNSPGTYTVCLTSVGPCGIDTICRPVTALCQTPSATFGTTVNNLFVSFSDSSLNTNAWFWDFGDGNTAVGPNPAYVYQQGGTYTVCLIASNNCGSDTTCQTVSVGCNAPIASFAYSNNDTIFQFISTSTISGATTYFWDFGDGNSSTAFNPTYVYNQPGTYTVCLYLGGTCGADTSCQSVVVTCPAPMADFNWTWAGSSCTFNDISLGGDNWVWNFGDGNTSAAQNPTHTYMQSGTYSVCLSINNQCGADNICHDVELCMVEADFDVLNTSICVGDTLALANLSSGASNYQWLLNGNLVSSQAWAEPVIQVSGFNMLELVGGDGICTDTAHFEFWASALPEADFNAAASGTQVSFMDQSLGNPVAWHWEFGDGNSSSQQNPNYNYLNEDTFYVCLTVTNGDGCQDTYCDSVAAVITAAPSPLSQGLRVYPNPAEQQFTLLWEGSKLKQAHIQLFDMAGKAQLQLHRDLKSGDQLQFKTEALSRGIYLLKVESEGKTYLQKVVLK